MVKKSYLISILALFTLVAYAQSEILPFPGCLALHLAFKFLGCSGGTKNIDYCQYMALALRLQLETGEKLCNAVPCVGYDQTGKSCTASFPTRKCSSSKRYQQGVCPLLKECCKD